MSKKKISDKKLRKKAIRLMSCGNLPEATAAIIGISIQEFESRMASSPKNLEALQLAETMLMRVYQDKLKGFMMNPPRNNEPMKLFYSHFLKVMERKHPTQMQVEENRISHEDALQLLKDK